MKFVSSLELVIMVDGRWDMNLGIAGEIVLVELDGIVSTIGIFVSTIDIFSDLTECLKDMTSIPQN